MIDAPLPGIGDWDNIIKSPLLWHFNFRGPDMERLVAGRERIYLDRFWNELSADPKAIDEATREHYAALYARPRAMHDAFEQFAAFTQDAADNRAFVAAHGKLTVPVLALGGEKSFGARLADHVRAGGDQRHRQHHPRFGSLGDGGESGGDDAARPRLPREVIFRLASSAWSP